MSRKNNTYSFETKLKAVKMYLEDGMGSTKISKVLGLSSDKRVLLWVQRYKELGEDGLKERRGTTKSILRGRPKKKFNSIEEEMERLRAENDYLKKLLESRKV